MALDPLADIASLCGRGGEVLSLRLHAMQDRIPPEEVARAVEKVRRALWGPRPSRPPTRTGGRRSR